MGIRQFTNYSGAEVVRFDAREGNWDDHYVPARETPALLDSLFDDASFAEDDE